KAEITALQIDLGNFFSPKNQIFYSETDFLEAQPILKKAPSKNSDPTSKQIDKSTNKSKETSLLTEGPLAENQRYIRNIKKGITAGRLAVKYPVGSPAPRIENLGVLGSKPGAFFGVGIPGLSYLAANNRAENLAENPFASEFEKTTAQGAALAAGGSFGLGVLNQAANMGMGLSISSRANGLLFAAAKGTAKLSPGLSFAYSLCSGLAHYTSGKSHGYISEEANLALSGGEIAAGGFNLTGAMIFLSSKAGGASLALFSNPVTAAGLVIVGGLLSLTLPLIHEHLSSQGVGEQIAKALEAQILKGGHDSQVIEKHLRIAKSYHLFNDTAIFTLLEELGDKAYLKQIDWHQDALVYELRIACYQYLLGEVKHSLIVSDEKVAALLYFAMYSHDSAIQEEAIKIYQKEVGKEGPWTDFIKRYDLGAENQKISHFVSKHLPPQLWSELLINAWDDLFYA
ncbi:MAG: hypothetical protein KDK66_01515, partial [Deltaproteobacteria bacterium]|nr:hypothetical protein [Deltaproteobacteria bacterium]